VTPWYEESFGERYLDLYPHRSEAEAEQDVQKLLTLTGLHRDKPVLDLGCGAGRHLQALRAHGFNNLVGLDLSEALLREAARRLSSTGGGVTLVRGDMRVIPFQDRFAAVLSFFTSIGYFETDSENARVFTSVFESLAGDGLFVIDFFNRIYVIENIVAEDERTLQGMLVRSDRSISNDGRRIVKKMRVTTEQGEEMEFTESVRLFTGTELVALLTGAGFTDICTYGSLSGEPFTRNSERLVVVASKPA
jgi:SAM-dependent methyltransferase